MAVTRASKAVARSVVCTTQVAVIVQRFDVALTIMPDGGLAISEAGATPLGAEPGTRKIAFGNVN